MMKRKTRIGSYPGALMTINFSSKEGWDMWWEEH